MKFIRANLTHVKKVCTPFILKHTVQSKIEKRNNLCKKHLALLPVRKSTNCVFPYLFSIKIKTMGAIAHSEFGAIEVSS